MLVLYYGLERHLVYGNFEDAFFVIGKLREIYLNERFQRDSLMALVFSSTMRGKIDYARNYFLKLLNEHKVNLYYEYLLYFHYCFDIPLTAFSIMEMAHRFWYKKSHIKKHPELFEKNINQILIENYNDIRLDIRLYISDRILATLSKKDTVFTENRSLRDIEFYYYNISEDDEFNNTIVEILNRAHEITKKDVK